MTKRLISLGDLGVLLQPYQAVNLLDRKNYPNITEGLITISLKAGALYRVRDWVRERKIPPAIKDLKGPAKIGVSEQDYPSKIRSLLEHKEFNYDEMQVSDEEYAKENADSAEMDDSGKYRKE